MARDDWNRFERTGAVTDYLHYKARERQEQSSSFEMKAKEQACDNEHYGDRDRTVRHAHGGVR